MEFEIPPVCREDGTPLTPDELEEMEREFALNAFTPITKEEHQRRKETRLANFRSTIRLASRKGQLTPEEWASPWGHFHGLPSLLYELNPDFEMREEANLGDLIKAVYDAVTTSEHPKAQALKLAWANFKTDKNERQGGTGRLFYEWDIILGATEKYHVSDFVLAEFYEKVKSRNYTLREQMEWIEKQRKKTEKNPTPRAPGTLPLKSSLRFTGDNIHRASVCALARGADWQDGEEYFKGLEQEYKNLQITIFLPNGEKAASLWEFLRRGGAATVKAHYALWARYYEQTDDGLVLEDVVVNVNDFCRDLGYRKHKGAYKPETKRRAMQLLEALTTAEMTATYQVPGTKKGHTKTRRLKGTLWRRGLEAEERDTYEDQNGQTRTGDPGQWIPQGFSFSPGAWYADKEWRRYNRFVGKIGAGLMQLRADRDEWAILIGGYLGTLARVDQYRPRRLKIATILENTNLAQTDTHRQTEHREKFYRALDRLQEEGIIAGWKTEGFDDSEVDPEDLDALAEYGATDPYPEGDWRAAIVEFTFNFAADTHRLEAREDKAIKAKAKRATKKKAKAST